MKIREMKYTKDRHVFCLAKGNYEGFDYVIISYGTHPCSYIRIPKGHKYHNIEYGAIDDFDCHYGLTYCGKDFIFNPIVVEDSWWIGWDYCHCNDFSGIYMIDEMSNGGGKKWDTDELISEMELTIRQNLVKDKQ